MRVASALLLVLGACYAERVLGPRDPAQRFEAAAPPPIPDSIVIGWGAPPAASDPFLQLKTADTGIRAMIGVIGTDTGQVIRVAVLATDSTGRRATNQPPGFADCPMILRLHAGSPSQPLASTAGAVATGCHGIHWGVNRSWAEMLWPVPRLLGDSLPAGRYEFTATVRFSGGLELEFPLGNAFLSPDRRKPSRDLDALQLAVRATVVEEGPRLLQGVVTVRNPTSRGIYVLANSPGFRLYRSASRSGRPVWEIPPPRISFPGPTGQPLYPGDTVVAMRSVPVHQVLGDSLPPGRYFVSLLVSMGGFINQIQAEPVDLGRTPDRLPSWRERNGLTYQAVTRVIPGESRDQDTVRTLVLISNRGSEPAMGAVSEMCPIVVHIFASEQLRDSVPIQTGASGSPSACGAVRPFHLQPGEIWVLHHDLPAIAVTAPYGPGRRYFQARLPQVTLAAGSADLTN